MKTKTLLNHVDGRLAAYATLAGAALAAPALVPSADATIIWSGAISINVPSTDQWCLFERLHRGQ